MTTFLLDANVLIALTVEEHVHHERASRWAGGVTSFALCPVVQGALVRFLLRMGETQTTAGAILAALRDRPGYEFWPDDLSYNDIDMSPVHGHRQVTDAYLVALARSRRKAVLATLDQALVSAFGDGAFLVPESIAPRGR